MLDTILSKIGSKLRKDRVLTKGEWYLHGFDVCGYRYRFIAWTGRLLLRLRIINEEQAKGLGNLLLTNYMLSQIRYDGGKVNVEVD